MLNKPYDESVEVSDGEEVTIAHRGVATPGPAWAQARAIIAGAWVASLMIAVTASVRP